MTNPNLETVAAGIAERLKGEHAGEQYSERAKREVGRLRLEGQTDLADALAQVAGVA